MAASRLSTTAFEPDVLDVIAQEDEDRVLAKQRVREVDLLDQSIDAMIALRRLNERN